MPISHKVVPGDCIPSLAARHGLDPEAVWNAPENQQLRTPRDAAPEVLAPASVVFLPDRQTRWESRAHGQFHPFKAKTIPHRLKIRFLDNGEPRAGIHYVLKIDSDGIEGDTDADGAIDQPLPAKAADVRIRLGDPQSGEDYFLKLGHLDPVDRVSGAQQRLSNLGFEPGPIDNILGPKTAHALRLFQQSRDIRVTGALDDDTHRELFAAHRS